MARRSTAGGGASTGGEGGGEGGQDGGQQRGEFRSGPIVGTLRREGVTGTQVLHYAEVDGEALFEGDIVLGALDALRSSDASGEVQHGVVISGAQFRWPGGQVAYEIDPALPDQQRVTDAIAHWESHTAVRFQVRSGQADFIRFRPGSGCSSMVGRRGGQQAITLGGGCTTGNTIHEIGHAVGLWHEQSREDRDTHVEIIWANIDPAMSHNFSQHISDGDDVGGYEFGSIMHYPRTAFSINGQDTIRPRVALPAGVVMGQRTGLSAGDIAAVNAMYPPPVTTAKELAKDPIGDGVHTRKELVKDPIRDGAHTIKEIRKDPIADVHTRKELAKDPLTDPMPTRKEGIGDLPGPWTRFGRLRPGGDASPFVTATPHAYAGLEESADPVADALELLAEAVHTAQAAADTAAAAYEATVALLGGA